MSILTALLLGIIISTTLITFVSGYYEVIWFHIKKGFKAINKRKTFWIPYPENLTTDEEIANYIKSNRISFPEPEEWDLLLSSMIKEMIVAGWNTKIPIYTKLKQGNYELHVITEDNILCNRLYAIIHKYEEKYDFPDSSYDDE
ncbi:hypothetical protein [Pedobacter caeni]|uniref:Uncharacterized protein n=1 Tax=Pedobacter caeni TaxID=288992 RepID=A0A1M5IX97_9SPHI|nr:hypothetical protein [Pedobacter caeni]SHG32978.1 hypothetical protein SAMN04488522_105105 [Pedobacter caeni]